MPEERRSFSRSVAIWLMRLVTLIAALWSGLIVFFVNPINWKLYSQFTIWDWIWSWASNIGTLVVALVAWWCVQQFITRKFDAQKNA